MNSDILLASHTVFHILYSREVCDFGRTEGLVKNHSYFMQAVCTLLWIDCFENYMVVTYPLDLSYHEKSQEISVLKNMGPLKPVNPHQDVDALRALCLHMSLFSNR